MRYFKIILAINGSFATADVMEKVPNAKLVCGDFIKIVSWLHLPEHFEQLGKKIRPFLVECQGGCQFFATSRKGVSVRELAAFTKGLNCEGGKLIELK